MGNKNELEDMDIRCEPGTKVVFSGLNGSDSDVEQAKAILEVGKTYTVSDTEISNWHTDVYLEEVHGGFNSCMFVTPESWKKYLSKNS